MQTSNLNIPVSGSSALVPVGLVNSRVNQIDANSEGGGDSMIESLKKQKCGNISNARSAAAMRAAPVGHNESLKCALSGLREA